MKFWHSERLSKPLTQEEEEKRKKELEDVDLTFSDHLIMVATAFVHVFLPAILILVAMVLIAMFVFRLL